MVITYIYKYFSPAVIAGTYQGKCPSILKSKAKFTPNELCATLRAAILTIRRVLCILLLISSPYNHTTLFNSLCLSIMRSSFDYWV